MKNGITHLSNGFDISELSKEQLDKVFDVYVCPSFSCNIKCPHCTLRNIPTLINEKKLFKSIEVFNTSNSKNICFNLFGGEPLLNNDELLEKLYKSFKKRYIVSTNLLNYRDTEVVNKLLTDAEWIDTSWNPLRFKDDEYNLWLKNIEIVKSMGIKINFMITLTDDFVDSYTPKQFLEMMRQWDVYSLDLEYYIGDDIQDINKIDDFLVELYKIWDIPTIFNNVENIKGSIISKSKYKDCSNTYTIRPNGLINKYCPYYEEEMINPECFICEYYNYCNGGCPLQYKCTLPKKLYKCIKENL